MRIASVIKSKTKAVGKSLLIKVWSLTNPQFDSSQDYCTCSPDNVFGVYIGRCCYQHDNDFPKTKQERITSHAKLRDCIYYTMTSKGKSRLTAYTVSRTYYRCLRMFSGFFY